jgi:RND family efflux transporter MFP subunit
MVKTTHSKWRMLWLVPPLVIGVVVFNIMVKDKQPPTLAAHQELATAVRVMQLEATTFTPIAKGHGLVQPAQVWTAVAEVSGRIVSIHPRLRDGEILVAGTELLQIDPVDYQLKLAEAEAGLAELSVQRDNAQAFLAIEKRNLELAGAEYKRIKNLATKGTVSASNRDDAERALLNSRSAVQNLENTLALIPTQKKVLEAKLTQAARDVSQTRITAPFNIRVSGLAVEANQYVGTGQVLFAGDSIDRVEVIAQVSISTLRKLFTDQPNLSTDIGTMAENVGAIAGFKPEVRLDVGDGLVASWQAEFVRMSDTIDSQTRTLGIVVAVDRPYEKIIMGERPPLSKGMFVEVWIAGRDQADRLLVPRTALRGGLAYIANADNRLEIRKPSTLFSQDQSTIIDSGINPGEFLVLSDIVPAVEGMLLAPTRVSGQ